MMEDVESLFKTAVGEIERMLIAKSVVGDPITLEGTTIIPLVSLGFGVGAGGGTGKMAAETAEGKGGGTGGGGGVKPVAVVIVDKHGVRVEPIKGGATSVLEKVIDTVGKATRKRSSEPPG